MDEKEWVAQVVSLISPALASCKDYALSVAQGARLAYAHEVRSYYGNEPGLASPLKCETDLLVWEHDLRTDHWIPRVVLEAKLMRVSTHDAITYSEKALAHKKVHPYLRYGILLGDRRHYPLPGRLYRHGAYFDFMLSWVGYAPTNDELADLANLIIEEVGFSKQLEEMLYSSRSPNRQRYTILQKKLDLRPRPTERRL